MLYRNNADRLGCWLHRRMLRNSLAGLKNVVPMCRIHHVNTVARQKLGFLDESNEVPLKRL